MVEMTFWQWTLLLSGMTAATYIPRLLPFLFNSFDKLPNYVTIFLKYIPWAALGALIIPNAFISAEIHVAIAAIAAAALLSWWKGGILIPVGGAIVAAFIAGLI